jgi:hypothetical protein
MKFIILKNHVSCKECGWQEVHNGEPMPVRFPMTDTDACPKCNKTKCFELQSEYNCLDCNDSGQNSDGSGCASCCPHNEHDHFMCLDCGHEGIPPDYYDEDYGSDR